MKKFLSSFIVPLFLVACNQSTNKDVKTYNQKEVDSLVTRITLLDSLVKTENLDSLKIINQEILTINQRLNKMLPISEFLKIMKDRNTSNIKRKEEKGMKGFYSIGMTDKEIRQNLGKPDKINRSVYSSGVEEQWIYESKDLYLYFNDGVLTSFQEQGK